MAEVAKCPKCGRSIDEAQYNVWCNKCREPLPKDILALLPKVLARAAAYGASIRESQPRLPSEEATDSYKVVPFIGQISTGFLSSDNANTVAQQMRAAIVQEAQAGWDFHSFAKVDVEVSPGCIASLFGARASSVTFDQLIFRRRQV
jgi:hypothetical protein